MTRLSLSSLALTGLIITGIPPLIPSAQASPRTVPGKLPPMCQSNSLSLGTDTEGGNFDGMSHSGAPLVLRNIGPDACRIQRLPSIRFFNAAGEDLHIQVALEPVRGMHPGPVMLPIVIAPNAEATSSLRWVSSLVFDPGVCLAPKRISVLIEGDTLSTTFGFNICGQTANTIRLTPTWFQLDPIWKPAP